MSLCLHVFSTLRATELFGTDFVSDYGMVVDRHDTSIRCATL